jgi:hypothetical protein
MGYRATLLPCAVFPLPAAKDKETKTSDSVHLSTVVESKLGNPPWLNIGSAGWLNIQSALTQL